METKRIKTILPNPIEVIGLENIEKAYVYSPPAKKLSKQGTFIDDGYNEPYMMGGNLQKKSDDPFLLDEPINEMAHDSEIMNDGYIMEADIFIVDGVIVDDQGNNIEDEECKGCEHKKMENCRWCYPTLLLEEAEDNLYKEA